MLLARRNIPDMPGIIRPSILTVGGGASQGAGLVDTVGTVVGPCGDAALAGPAHDISQNGGNAAAVPMNGRNPTSQNGPPANRQHARSESEK